MGAWPPHACASLGLSQGPVAGLLAPRSATSGCHQQPSRWRLLVYAGQEGRGGGLQGQGAAGNLGSVAEAADMTAPEPMWRRGGRSGGGGGSFKGGGLGREVEGARS